MTNEEFRELFGNHDEQYIKISDLREILVKPSEVLVSDSLFRYEAKIWEPNNKTKVTALRAFREVFGKDWTSTLTFPMLIKEFKRLTYVRGVGKKTIQPIIKLCELEGIKLPISILC